MIDLIFAVLAMTSMAVVVLLPLGFGVYVIVNESRPAIRRYKEKRFIEINGEWVGRCLDCKEHKHEKEVFESKYIKGFIQCKACSGPIMERGRRY